MDELLIDGKVYVSSKRAAQVSGYAKDYVGQMCREGRIEARLVGRSWYVLLDALKEHRFKDDKSAAEPLKETNKIVDSTWEAPKYTQDRAVSLPELDRATNVNRLVSPSARDMHAQEEAHTVLVSQMQDAWQEWFTKKDENIESVADRTEVSVVIEEEIEVPTASASDISLTEEVHEEAEAMDTPEEEAESIPVVRITETSVRKVETRKPERQAKVSPYSRFLLQGTFALVTIIAVAVGVIGTVGIESLTGISHSNAPVLNFIAGVEAINSK